MATKRILVIDDEGMNVRIIKELFEARGFEVFTASNGIDGVQKALIHNPSIILADLIMPEKDGFEVCRMLKDIPETHNTPIILITGFEAENLMERSKFFGADALVTKPYIAEDLVKKVRDMLQAN
jgi:CheY-like chemotaxis protein